MKPGSAAKLNVDALLQWFLPLARRCIETAQVQSVASFFSHVMSAIGGNTAGPGHEYEHANDDAGKND